MATIVLSAAGAAIGSSVGGTFLGLSATAVGRFMGATIGRRIDQRLMGSGSEVVEQTTGQTERFRLTGAGEGDAITRVYGRMRVGGQVIWASKFTEKVTTAKSTTGGGSGKGMAAPKPKVTTKTTSYSYSVSLAVALCEGEITNVARVWADGTEVSPDDLNMRVYTGAADQMPDPTIEAVEGAGQVPAYRGTAYVVMEDLELGQFGNRIPQFSFEVARPVQTDAEGAAHVVAYGVQGVALMPGTGEYALASQPVYYDYGKGKKKAANLNTPSGKTDLVTSLEMLEAELPNCGAASLIVSWFGDDLRCGDCTIRPKVEQTEFDSAKMPWEVAGVARSEADVVTVRDGEPVYGGTPSDASVVQSIKALKAHGQDVMFYPFILMDQDTGNGLPDPWTGAADQPALPWRGRITLDVAPGREGTSDQTASADAQVDAFFGTAVAADFTVGTDEVSYSGAAEWSFRRFILHYAALCAAAGGVDSFCIGSEMRGLTQIRGADGSFRAVHHLRELASEVHDLLGPGCKIGYAADWSEYFGYIPPNDSGDRFFHLDPLWADPNIDFVGIDNYMPLSDWRDGDDHADADWQSIYHLDYLRANIEGGEGYEWYYASDNARDAQIRTPITDEAHDEAWVWRYKDIRAWWDNLHHERIGGVRQENPTGWIPGMKPIWFTEIGCAAIDKGTNQPNKFLDPKSSESKLPHYSNGRRDELMQARYLQAMFSYWTDTAHNPVSDLYTGQMIDMSRCFVWAWDARPYPWFPNRLDLWSDGENYLRGHWLNGRVSGRSLASVVAEICEEAGLTRYDVSQVHGWVRGYEAANVGEGRSLLQPLMLRYGFDAVERDGVLCFVTRDGKYPVALDPDRLAIVRDVDGRLEEAREAEAELSGRVRLRYVVTDGDFDIEAEEAVLPEDRTHAVSTSDLPIAMTRSEAHETVERWLTEARVARESARFALPPSQMTISPGDVVRLEGAGPLYRVDRVEDGGAQIIDAVRIEPEVYRPTSYPDVPPKMEAVIPPVPIWSVFMDLPLLTGEEVPHAPHIAVTADPWPGGVAVYSSASDSDYGLDDVIAAQSVMGVTETTLEAAQVGLIDRGAALRIKLNHGALESVDDLRLLSGANAMAIGDGSPGNWEVFQFRDATLVAPGTWEVRHRLRGQVGTDAVMPSSWPVGSVVVLLSDAVQQIPLSLAQRGIERHFRIGPSNQGYDHDAYEYDVQSFAGNGLRPYRPCHLRVTGTSDLTATWIRRTRIDGDRWDLTDVPLGEARELYSVQVVSGGTVLRDESIATPVWTYSAAMQSADGAGPGDVLRVAQVSELYGPGPYAEIALG